MVNTDKGCRLERNLSVETSQGEFEKCPIHTSCNSVDIVILINYSPKVTSGILRYRGSLNTHRLRRYAETPHQTVLLAYMQIHLVKIVSVLIGDKQSSLVPEIIIENESFRLSEIHLHILEYVMSQEVLGLAAVIHDIKTTLVVYIAENEPSFVGDRTHHQKEAGGPHHTCRLIPDIEECRILTRRECDRLIDTSGGAHGDVLSIDFLPSCTERHHTPLVLIG